jgi:cyclopropane fatty-acyl-phospholipid synthase-like methyltransferase
MDSYQITFETWNKVASVYQDKFMDLDLYNDTYDRFCQLIEKPNPSIFEIGCGPGNITRYLLTKRPDFRIEAIDIAPNMITLAQNNNPTAHFRVMDCRQMDTATAQYDAIVAGFCMPYLSKEDSAKFLKDCSGLLHKGGILYFSTIKGDYSNSGYAAGSTGDECYVYYYEEDYLRQTLAQNHFELLEVKHKHFSKTDGMTSTDMIFIARKAE